MATPGARPSNATLTRVRRSFRSFLVGVAAALTFVVTCETSRASPAGAQALEARLYAPCCYGGTLDIHESDLARSLREEIALRLEGGETSDSIQADFVGRYGEKILAARSDSPIRAMGLGVAILTLLSGAALVFVMRRWTRRLRPAEAHAAPAASAKRDALDARIDAELADLDA
ncbi:MAG: hypothetical protein BGO98_00785 [Myxococcales bacterium 68-20]|nr:MAG: hypothetical protein BGO98_00785 [Myxococcales bacterium 68-20]